MIIHYTFECVFSNCEDSENNSSMRNGGNLKIWNVTEGGGIKDRVCSFSSQVVQTQRVVCHLAAELVLLEE